MPVFRLKTAAHSGASFIYIRLYDRAVGLSGGDGANAQFFFDRNDKLQDIQIFQFGGYL